MRTYCVLLFVISCASADIYMHNPRGSNNRLDEQGRARNNANRLFDSQNNNRGGYNVGSLYYYEGSRLNLEWTNQHSCKGPNNHCELIIQYMCGDYVRDGATTATIPDNPMQCQNYDCNTDTRYGMHEDYDYYMNCKLRERNKGLFLADQNLGGHRNRAKNTRQNPGGTRRGYECPEERDHYPYWHPTPWKDVAVMTNDATRCPYYQKESENVKGRWACVIPRYVLQMNAKKGILIPNNKEKCEAFRWPTNDKNGTRAEWKQFPSHNLPAPVCRETEFSRDNHLGNGIGGNPNTFNWTIPDIDHERCTLRIRYNISTADYEAWDGSVNASHNSRRPGKEPSKLDLSARYGLPDQDTAKERGYVFKNNPEVKLFPGLDMKLRLAINTAQFSRTFQDRSHTFAVRKRPADLKGAEIHNLNVRGKRGNIVQVYPAVEYDFVPNTLEMSKGDYVHVQWTGSNTNPKNNDGQGRAGTDRSNVVLQAVQFYNEGSGIAYNPGTKFGHWGRSYPEILKNTSLLGMTKEDMMHLALLTTSQFRGEMSELDDAGTYFDLGPRKVTQPGNFHYLCTRNNNFSNRSQKGRLICLKHPVSQDSIGWNGGTMAVDGGAAEITVAQGTFESLQNLRMEEWEAKDAEEQIRKLNRQMPISNNYASKFLMIHPEDKIASADKTFTVKMKVTSNSPVTVYRSNSNFGSWTKVESQVDDGVASFAAQEGGVYVAVYENNVGLIVGIVMAVVAIAVIVLATVIYFKKYPDKWASVKGNFRFAQRSMQNKV